MEQNWKIVYLDKCQTPSQKYWGKLEECLGLRTVYRIYGLYGTRKRLRHPYRCHSVAAKPVEPAVGLDGPVLPINLRPYLWMSTTRRE
jgi:hypothetical protein